MDSEYWLRLILEAWVLHNKLCQLGDRLFEDCKYPESSRVWGIAHFANERVERRLEKAHAELMA